MSNIQDKTEVLKDYLLQKYIQDYKFSHQWDDDYDEKLAIPYAKKCLDTFLQLEGPSRLFKSEEICDGISLTTYLDKIRNLNEEACLLIAIKDDKIIEIRMFTSDRADIITVDDYIKNDIFKLISEWSKNDYKVLNYHNHPNSIAARPSNTDIINLKLSSTKNPIIKKQLERFDLLDFDYYDWGVVTEFDFYSELQEAKSNELYIEFENISNMYLY